MMIDLYIVVFILQIYQNTSRAIDIDAVGTTQIKSVKLKLKVQTSNKGNKSLKLIAKEYSRCFVI